MDPDRWKRIEQIYQAALARDENERPAFLRQACGNDSALLQELESLLAEEEGASGYMSRLAMKVLRAPNSPGTYPNPRHEIGRLTGRQSLISAQPPAGLPPGPRESGDSPTREAVLSPPGKGLSFTGNERFEVVRKIGAGGMGAVYEAIDKHRNARVALKTLLHLDSRALYLFKQEFRSLAGVVHPNLVSLYELFSMDEWFFTMEFIEGTHFLDYVCTHRRVGGETPLNAVAINMPTESTVLQNLRLNRTDPPGAESNSSSATPQSTRMSQEDQRHRPVCDFERLYAVLHQLVRGVSALHGAAKLHRDLKPSNVIVTPEGRLVIVDFGLTRDLGGYRDDTMVGLAGTVAYMSPEQAACKPLSEASDWYAVGVMLFQALSGHLPFTGSTLQVLHDKQKFDAPPVKTFVSEVPAELSRLCSELLRRRPDDRPGSRDILQRLGGEHFRGVVPSRPAKPPAAGGSLFVGREDQLAALHDAFRASSQTDLGRTVLVCVRGKSGIGKSALIDRFLSEVADRDDVVILRGRCVERELVPYKALDSLVDSLLLCLKRLPHEIVPRDAAALAKIFPVLVHADVFAEAQSRSIERIDQHELRRRAFGALRELLARLGDRKKLILYIDDLQWGDDDSALLLADILRPPDAPVLTLICSYREEDADRNDCLRTLLNLPYQDKSFEKRFIALEALTAKEAQLLAEKVLDTPTAGQRALQIARESGGHPYFILELAQRTHQMGTGSVAPSWPQGEVTLDSAIWERVSSLPEDARQLMETIAVAGRPLRQSDAFVAAGLDSRDPKILTLLHSARLVRSTGTGVQDLLESYHDRVRETVVKYLAADTLRGVHHRLAVQLESREYVDAETVAAHFEAAGQRDRAGHYYSIAAQRAADTLAFQRAANLFRLALQLQGATTGEDRRRLQRQLADALANAGRGVEAARAYQECITGATEPEVFQLERLTAYYFAISGHVDEGRAAFRQMLYRVGQKLPESGRSTLLSLLAAKLHLRLRNLRFYERAESEIAPEQLRRVDVVWSAAIGLAQVDLLAGAYFTARAAILALQAGEPYRIARALAWEATTDAALNQAGKRRAAKIFALCRSLVSKLDRPQARGLLAQCEACVALTSARYSESRRLFARAERVLTEECTGVTWELFTTRMFALYNFFFMGDWAELKERSALLFKDAQERSDLYIATSVGTLLEPAVRLADDRPAEAMRILENSLAQWSREGYYMQHVHGAEAHTYIHLYQGDPASALRHMNEQWSNFRKYGILRFEIYRVLLYHLRGLAALNTAYVTPDDYDLHRTVELIVKRLKREVYPLAAPLAASLSAGLAWQRGERAGAIAGLEETCRGFEALEMEVYLACARRCLGLLYGGERGATLLREADDLLHAQKIVNPARITCMMIGDFGENEILANHR